MLATIYTRELEPITIVWIGSWAEKMLRDHGRILLAGVFPTPRTISNPDEPPKLENWIVRLRGHLVRIGGAETWVLTTDDEELALTLKAAFLPGQQRHVRDLERIAMGKGVGLAFELIRKLGGGA